MNAYKMLYRVMTYNLVYSGAKKLTCFSATVAITAILKRGVTQIYKSKIKLENRVISLSNVARQIKYPIAT